MKGQNTQSSWRKNLVYLAVIFAALGGLFLPPGVVRADGEAGFSLSFDGVNDYVHFGDVQEVFGGTTIWKDTKTVSFWVKPSGTGEVCENSTVAWCDHIVGDRPRWWGVARGNLTGEDRIWVWNYDGNYDMVGVPYAPGEWVHIAYVHADGLLRAYKNGNFVGQVFSGPTVQPDTGALPDLQIGAVINNTDRSWPFAGEMDELRLYTIGLTQQQIQDELFSELNGTETGLQAYYKMSDGSGTTLTDDSGNGHDGTLEDGGGIVPANGSYPLWVTSGAFDTPIAENQSVSIQEDQVVSVTLVGRAYTPGSLSYSIVTPPANGSLSGTAPNLTFTPSADFSGSDSFTFTVSDGSDTSTAALVSIQVQPVNDAPVGVDDDYEVAMNASLQVNAPGVLSNDQDVDNSELSAVQTGSASHGQLILYSNGSFQYTPETNYSGPDSFTYRVSDGLLESETVTVSIQVTPPEKPTAYDLNISLDEDAFAAVTLSGASPNSDDLDYYIINEPDNGTLSGTAPNLTYTPDLNYAGTDSFTYVINDGVQTSETALVSITVNPVNDAPAAEADYYETEINQLLNVAAPGLLLNDEDVDGDSLEVVPVSSPDHGQLTLNSDGSFQYDPDENYTGVDQFTYRASDSLLESSIVTVTINVAADAQPVANDINLNLDEDTTREFVLNGSSSLTTELEYTIINQPQNGTLSGDAPNLTYIPDADFAGDDHFTYQVSDGIQTSEPAEVNITVNPVNDAPEAFDDQYAIEVNAVLIVRGADGVLKNDVDVEGDRLSAEKMSDPANGALTFYSNGSFQYIPNQGFTGTDSFTYRASDGALVSQVRTVRIAVGTDIPNTGEHQVFLPVVIR